MPPSAVSARRLAEEGVPMPRDPAYLQAEKNIREVLKSGATEKPLPTSPKGEETGNMKLQMTRPTFHPKRISPSPLGGKLASRGGIMPPSAVSARRLAEEGGSPCPMTKPASMQKRKSEKP